MLVHLPSEHIATLVDALKQAGTDETGGVLMAEHVGESEFRVVRLSVQSRRGSFARFVRLVDQAVSALRTFFRDTGREYTRFNYLGEWHSHPQFEVHPSEYDNDTMFRIISDREVGATFVVLLIVRLQGDDLATGAWMYTPEGRFDVRLSIDSAPSPS